MTELLKPTGILLVGLVIFLIFFTLQGISESSDPFLEIKEYHSQFLRPTTCMDSTYSSSPQIMKYDLVNGRARELGGLVALNSQKQQNLLYEGPLESAARSNSMNLEVKGITVIAMNMVQGGNAVADSDIVLNPVQYINISDHNEEIGEKLK
jgi:hypothetical protein